MQNDSTSTAAKDLDVALADDRIVLILDDTEHVSVLLKEFTGFNYSIIHSG